MIHFPALILSLALPMTALAQTSKSSSESKTKAPIKTANPSEQASPQKKETVPRLRVSSISSSEIEGFSSYDPRLQKLIEAALKLTTLNLAYHFGSSDPKSGGMDCSGTMFHLLRVHGQFEDLPRQSDHIGEWSMERSVFYRTESTHSLTDASLSALHPGDLLFWAGTYEPSQKRKTPITHVMLYLGKHTKTQKPLMFGASEGRVYQGQSHYGVSVFDFTIPNRESKSHFYGYAPLPGFQRTHASSLAAQRNSR